jgi:predicted nucleic acid-binding Zn ribbon protein
MLDGGVRVVTILKRILQRQIRKGTNLLDCLSVGQNLEVFHACEEDPLTATSTMRHRVLTLFPYHVVVLLGSDCYRT